MNYLGISNGFMLWTFPEEMAYSLILYPVTCIKAGSVFFGKD